MSLMDTAQLLGNFGEFIASVAVLATLIYLAVQVRQAKHQLTIAGMQARAHHARGVLDPIYMSSDLAEIIAKLDFVNYGEYGIGKEETVMFGAWCHTWMQAEQGSFYLLPEGAHDELRKWWLSTPAGAEFWAVNKGIYDKPFVEYMEGLRVELELDSRTSANIFAGVGTVSE